MMKGKTSTGFEYEVDEDVFDDMELIDALADVTSGRDSLQISAAVLKIFGTEQRKKLYDHLRNEHGRVPTEKIMDAITEIVESSEESKKS